MTYSAIKRKLRGLRTEIAARSGQIWREVLMLIVCLTAAVGLVQHQMFFYGTYNESAALDIPFYWYIFLALIIYGYVQTVVFYYINRVFEEAAKVQEDE